MCVCVFAITLQLTCNKQNAICLFASFFGDRLIISEIASVRPRRFPHSFALCRRSRRFPPSLPSSILAAPRNAHAHIKKTPGFSAGRVCVNFIKIIGHRAFRLTSSISSAAAVMLLSPLTFTA